MSLAPIDIETIRDLKRRGLRGDANKLLKAYRESIEEEKRQIMLEWDRDTKKIKHLQGLCTIDYCNTKIDTKELELTCQGCRNKKKTRYKQIGKSDVCRICGMPRKYGKSYCETCRKGLATERKRKYKQKIKDKEQEVIEHDKEN